MLAGLQSFSASAVIAEQRSCMPLNPWCRPASGPCSSKNRIRFGVSARRHRGARGRPGGRACARRARANRTRPRPLRRRRARLPARAGAHRPHGRRRPRRRAEQPGRRAASAAAKRKRRPYRRALALAEQHRGPDAAATAAVLNDLAVTLQRRLHRGRTALAARAEHPRARARTSPPPRRRPVPGSRTRAATTPPPSRPPGAPSPSAPARPPELAAGRAALAAILDALGHYDEAETLRHALHAFQACFGTEHT
jgi:hypothetical protein